jgi:hypothetical protein
MFRTLSRKRADQSSTGRKRSRDSRERPYNGHTRVEIPMGARIKPLPGGRHPSVSAATASALRENTQELPEIKDARLNKTSPWPAHIRPLNTGR